MNLTGYAYKKVSVKISEARNSIFRRMSVKTSEIKEYFMKLEKFEKKKASFNERGRQDKLKLAELIVQEYKIKNEDPERVIGMMHKRRAYDLWKGNGHYFDWISCFNLYATKKFYRDETPFIWRWQFVILSNIESALEKGERLRGPLAYIGERIRSTMLPSSVIISNEIVDLDYRISLGPKKLDAVKGFLML